jgi:hypothetical protein
MRKKLAVGTGLAVVVLVTSWGAVKSLPDPLPLRVGIDREEVKAYLGAPYLMRGSQTFDPFDQCDAWPLPPEPSRYPNPETFGPMGYVMSYDLKPTSSGRLRRVDVYFDHTDRVVAWRTKTESLGYRSWIDALQDAAGRE